MKTVLRFLLFAIVLCLSAGISQAQTNKAYGDNMKVVDTVWTGPSTYDLVFAIFSGDIDQDGVMDASDFNAMEAQVAALATGYVTGDITGDRIADASDFNLLEANVAALVQVEHP